MQYGVVVLHGENGVRGEWIADESDPLILDTSTTFRDKWTLLGGPSRKTRGSNSPLHLRLRNLIPQKVSIEWSWKVN